MSARSGRATLFAALPLAPLVLAALGCVDRPSESPRGAAAAAPARLLPARVRRLTNHEIESTVSALVGAPVELAERLPPDVRQDGFSPNAEQDAPVAWTTRLDALARDIARTATTERHAELAPCAASATPNDRACADDLIARLGRRAFRRPLEPSEKAALDTTFTAGASGERGFAGGTELVLRALITSPGLLYVTELGPGGPPGSVLTLSPYETASLLAYTVRGTPPDDELLRVAATGRILAPKAREREARRLLGMRDTRHHFRRFVLEWLEVDGLERTAKSATLFPEYEAMRSRMLAETSAFVDEVMVTRGASVGALLDAGFASVDPKLARYYGLSTWGPRASLAKTERTGILQQASFLSAHAHEDSTSPVKRGDFVMRRLLCSEVRRPSELGIEVVIPPPSDATTTRERFSAHVADPSCRACHQELDALGYAFEGFDAAGRSRTAENGRPIDASGKASVAGRELRFANSAELSRTLARDPAVARCFARQAFRYFSAQHDPGVEKSFLELREELEPEQRGNLVEELVAFVSSDLFVLREVRAP